MRDGTGDKMREGTSDKTGDKAGGGERTILKQPGRFALRLVVALVLTLAPVGVSLASILILTTVWSFVAVYGAGLLLSGLGGYLATGIWWFSPLVFVAVFLFVTMASGNLGDGAGYLSMLVQALFCWLGSFVPAYLSSRGESSRREHSRLKAGLRYGYATALTLLILSLGVTCTMQSLENGHVALLARSVLRQEAPEWGTADFKLADIQIGMSEDEVLQILGNPGEIRAGEAWLPAGVTVPSRDLIYPGITVELLDMRPYQVMRVEVTSLKYRTPRGIAVGDSRYKVLFVYGGPTWEEEEAVDYQHQSDSYWENLTFRFNADGKVTEIEVSQLFD